MFATFCLAAPISLTSAGHSLTTGNEEVEGIARLGSDGTVYYLLTYTTLLFDFLQNYINNNLIYILVMSREKQIRSVNGLEQIFYRPVLELCNIKDCFPRLFAELVRIVSQGASEVGLEKRRRLAGWADMMFEVYLMVPETVATQQWRSILRHVVMAPQYFRDEHIAKSDRLKYTRMR